jgi:release factor glutamine methyltransferase
LIPRPDTERLVELALDKAPSQPATLLDLGTGTGAIALALASELGKHRILAIDIRPEAVQLAQQNARSLDLDNVQFLQGSWFAPLKNWQPDWDTSIYGTKFALIVSNPPYIEKDDPHLQQGDVRFEPLSALVAEEQGLADIRLIARDARDHLTQGGWLLFEHGREQGEAVRCVMDSYGYVNIVTEQDYAGSDRVTLAQYFSSTPTG